MKTVYMFDVDGTLTPARQRMKSNFRKFFDSWSENKIYYLITGSDFAKTHSQVDKKILLNANGLFTCMGNVLHVRGEKIYENSFVPPKNLMNDLNRFLRQTGYVLRTGRHIEERPGMINFSIVGRNASYMQREGYHTYDCREREREMMVEFINNKYSDQLEASIGGKISIDIYPAGNNKAQAFKWIHHEFGTNQIHYKFFGDQAKPSGNDWDLVKEMERSGVEHSYHCVKDYNETYLILMSNK